MSKPQDIHTDWPEYHHVPPDADRWAETGYADHVQVRVPEDAPLEIGFKPRREAVPYEG